MSEATHLCVNCETQGRVCAVTLTTTQRCAVCNSEAVLPLGDVENEIEKELKKRDVVVRETPPQVVDARYNEIKERVEAAARPVRAFLLRNKLDYVNDWWDGHISFVDYSVYIEANALPEWVSLTLTNVTGESYEIISIFDVSATTTKVVKTKRGEQRYDERNKVSANDSDKRRIN